MFLGFWECGDLGLGVGVVAGMQGGVGGRNPAVAPPGRSSTSSSASPSSSSSAVSAPPAHLGFDSIQHHQQQLGFRQVSGISCRFWFPFWGAKLGVVLAVAWGFEKKAAG